VRESGRAAHHLIRFLGIDAQAHCDVDGFVEFGPRRFFKELDALGEGVFAAPIYQRVQFFHSFCRFHVAFLVTRL